MTEQGIPGYDRDGNRVDMDRLVELQQDRDYKRVADDDVLTADGRLLWVSTVWLGIDHSLYSTPPLIFETMVFESGMSEDFCARYATEKDALAAHEAIVRQLEQGVPLGSVNVAAWGRS